MTIFSYWHLLNFFFFAIATTPQLVFASSKRLFEWSAALSFTEWPIPCFNYKSMQRTLTYFVRASITVHLTSSLTVLD